MKIKHLLTKTLLVAAGLLVGQGAWADGNKRVLNAQNYESATDASDWSAKATLKTGDATYGKYIELSPGSDSGNRGTYKNTALSFAANGYTTAGMTVSGYNIEFDMKLRSGSKNARSSSQFILSASNIDGANAGYSGTDYFFSLSQPTRDADSYNTTWYINDLTNATDKTVTLDYSKWYHYSFVVTATSVSYTITQVGESTPAATGSKTVESLPSISRIYTLLGRQGGIVDFDNLDIYDFTNEITVSAPTFSFFKVDGAGRVYTITNPDGSGTLYYTTSPADVAPAVGDAAYTSTTDLTKQVTYSASGNYYAYVLHTNGVTASTITTQAVTAGALTLATPQFTVVDMVDAGSGLFYPVVAFASDNSKLEGAPTATFDKTSPYTFTGVGSLTVTASADGYTSSSNTFEVNSPYVLSKTIDFGALTASDFDAAVWETATGAPRDKWTSGTAAIPADVTYYKLKDTSADNSAVLDGITIKNYNQRGPEVYIGYGLLTPYTAISGSGNYMNFTVNGGTASDYIVYNGWNNYGSGTFNTVLAGDATFGLYRYDTMLRTIKVYAPTTVTVDIKADGSTFSSAYPIDCDNLPAGVKAYKVTKMTASEVTASEVTGQVAANTGLILKADAAGTYDIPVVASGVAVEGNLLKAAVTATPVAADEAYGLKDGKFHKLKAGTISAGKAYLLAADITSAPDAPELTIVFGGEATGISEIKTMRNAENEIFFDLQGRKVAQPAKGLYIQNGRKVILK